MENKKKLSHDAYGGIKGDDYEPFISYKEAVPESSVISLTIGVIFAVVFAAANTYLGLKVGLTIAAGIPGAILATGLLKILFKRNNILEANMIASIAAVGESIAGGIIFVLPAVILWGMNLSVMTIFVVTAIGGLVGIYFVTPLRRFLIVEEHGNLVFPESMAAAEVLVTGMQGGEAFKNVLLGLAGGGIYKLLSGGFKLWLEEPEWTIKPVENTIFGVNTIASLLGVGFIVGLKASLYMFAGSLVAWIGFIPLIKYIGAGLDTAIYPSVKLIRDMNAWNIWSNYIKYIGAGAVATGGFISLGKSMPTIIKSFKAAIGGIGKDEKTGSVHKRIDEEPPIVWVIASAILVFLLSWLLPNIKVGLLGASLIVVFSFFFSVVSARMVGIIGASNNPVSGMTIATLLIVTSLLKITGKTGESGMMAALLIGGIVCVAIAVAGGTAQSLKTTFVIGGSPRKVQMGMYLGLLFAAVAAGAIVLMLNSAFGIGSKEVAAPQATLMALVVKGVMTGQLPWTLVIVGAVIAVFCEIVGLPILPVALGIYLPIHLNTGILIGGIIRVLVEKRFKNEEEKQKEKVERGILLCSGIVSGDALTGIIIAIFTISGINIAFGEKFLTALTGSPLFATILFLILGAWVYMFSIGGKDA
ncbi:putative oligopeptide transporter, OPT family [Hathewaya proteolytica DSM 3090]|uniref:Putative oligopeptide transporter, OPT family n=1 Tax=Hathewaya proteolytica DSM 3090 TaxID=1121331 RepID=A0A1M6RTU9_9CLOT|nr:oligopeptide transporter, OPT family [Hathewaya proteolytica]SHK35854.1 putative oligopeptide transporter, OPT family [Hathewaya proteolytica DSM 3090]